MTALYARQSVEKRDSLSIADQLTRCQALVPAGEPVRIYQDAGQSGGTVERPALQALLRDVRAGAISRIVVYRLDRLTRSLTDFADLIRLLDRLHVGLTSCTDAIDTASPGGRAMLGITMTFAQYERELIGERVRDNYYRRGEQGFYLGGPPPFGFDRVPCLRHGKRTAMLRENDCAEIVRMLYRDYVQAGMTLGELARRLHRQEIRTAAGKPFSTGTLGRLLRNPCYVRAGQETAAYFLTAGAKLTDDPADFDGVHGCVRYAPRTATGGRHPLAGSTITRAMHKGLIEEGLWLDAQRRLARGAAVGNGGRGTHTVLSGVLICGKCGYALTAVPNCRGIDYLTCSGRRLGVCPRRETPLRLREVEAAVLPVIFRRMAAIFDTIPVIPRADPQKANPLRAEQAALTARIGRLLDCMSESGEAARHFLPMVRQLDGQLREIETRLREIETRTEPHRGKKLLDAWDALPFAQRRAAVQAVVERITIENEEIRVRWRE